MFAVNSLYHDLNSRLQTQLPMKRFRPNLVVTGC
ncbi:MAG TPA: MOSC domain-containing protein, partial [Crenotrichaceae bacterium]|nr:MOSC domain-containing protein [Crenotrichaceae bacterium]